MTPLLLSWIVAFICLLSVVTSIPVPSTLSRRCRIDAEHLLTCMNDPHHTEAEGISEDLLRTFSLMASYSAAAYCPTNNRGNPGTPIKCATGNCPLVEDDYPMLLKGFEDTGGSDGTGFVAVDNNKKMIVLAIRGSSSKANWHMDFNVMRQSTGWCNKCNVHVGFWRTWADIRDVVLPIMIEASEEYPDYRMVVAGHSLGGAIATLAAGDIRQLSPHLLQTTELYTYGSPRVGNAHLARFLTNQSDKSYRITSFEDPVPRLPPMLIGYMHTSPEYMLPHWRSDNPKASQIKVLGGIPNHEGNTDSQWTLPSGHRHYFGDITLCGPTDDHSKWARSTGVNGTLVAADSVHAKSLSDALGLAYGILAPHLNTSQLAYEVALDGKSGNITFPPGSVATIAHEAVYGLMRPEDVKEPVTFQWGQEN